MNNVAVDRLSLYVDPKLITGVKIKSAVMDNVQHIYAMYRHRKSTGLCC